MMPYTPKIAKSDGNRITDMQCEVENTKYRNMANALRALAIDAIETARSGHPGLPLGAADVVTILFTQFLKFDPTDPYWPDRDRFILSAGHGSMLLYALLNLTGYEAMTLNDIKTFRQLRSRAAGHPEFNTSAGIETTTGPLGQGLATAVGMAIAECHLAAHFSALVDHYTYVLVSDGDLMEGISHEAAALAGNLKLNKLIVLFDDNGISIDGPVSLADTVDQLARFTSYGWQVMQIDGHDPQAISSAIKTAQNSTLPSLISCKTIIGYGAPNKQGTSNAHGSPLGQKEAKAAKDYLEWTHEPFEIPDNIRDLWRVAGLHSVKEHKAWKMRLEEQGNYIQSSFERRISGNLPSQLDETIKVHKSSLINAPQNISTRKASELMLNVITPVLPDMIGGSADLTGSNNTRSKDMTTLSSDDYSGRFIHYGIREHAMAAAMNGMALHGGIIPYSGTFLVFSDYCRPAIRLSAIMKQRVIYIMTHDSIGLGEDGPTHQPVEHLISLRSIPNLLVMRPCDAVETAECWQIALQNKNGPSLLALSRQDLPQLRVEANEMNSSKGGYVLMPASRKAQVTLIATGSETHLAMKAREKLEEEGIATTVVSLPCWELFDMQPKDYRHDVISPNTVRVAIEAGSSLGWERYVGEDGAIIALDRFGESAPHDDLYDYFHITPEAMIAAARNCLAKRNGHDAEKRR